MSNTDGEDRQRIEKEAKDYSDGYLHHSYGMKTGYIAGATLQLKELASLREQLKQQEEVIRELIPLARMFVVHKEWMGEECKTEKAIIEKAKSLTTKDK